MSRISAAAFCLASLLGLALASAAAAVQITEYPVPSGGLPLHIAAGPDGALWFTEPSPARIGRITTAGAVTEFPLPPGDNPVAITAGPDGALWFTSLGGVGRITTAGVVTHFPLEGGVFAPLDIIRGPDDALWIAYQLLVPGPGPLGRIARMTTSGAVTVFDVPAPFRVATALAAGPDGRIWLVGYGLATFGGNAFGVIGSIDVSGDAAQTYSLQSGLPVDITAGPDGNMWFTVRIGVGFGNPSAGPEEVGKIGRISTTLFPSISEFALPNAGATPTSIAAGPDGNVWFADPGNDSLGRVTPAGGVTEITLPTYPGDLAAGSDGALWFTEPLALRIGRASSLAATCAPSATALCLDNGRLRVEATWTTTDGRSGPATAVPLGRSSTAGYLWFFTPDTPELLVKTVEGCAFNGNVWFFAAGLTNVQVEIRVTDVAAVTGPVTKTYTSPAGPPFAPIQDTAAFPCVGSLQQLRR
jgi:virginiamycin B lyase